MVELVVQTGDLANAQADALVVNLFQGVAAPAGATGAVDAAAGGLLTRYLATGDFKGALGEIAVLYPQGLGAPRVLLVGLGKREKFDLDAVRRVSAKAAQKARDLGAKTVASVVHGSGVGRLDPEACGQAIAEGTLLGLYEFRLYRSRKPDDEPEKALERVTLVESDGKRAVAARRGVAAGVVIAESVNFARDVATVSGEEGKPAAIAERVVAMAKDVGLASKVLGREEARKLGMGSFLGVAQGSTNEPKFVVLEHKPKTSRATLVVCGKGITFDTGGISIKPSENMDHMRFDKCGAAATYGILRACALLKLPYHVVGLTPLTDNMPSGSAVKPGDILRAMNGTTIEVLNTDAEGRLVLADALAYADRYEPDAVVDVATLTGAVSIALGTQAIGLMGNDARLLARIKKSGEATHERAWELPFFEEYEEQLKSKVADVKNIGGRNGGAITGGKFLQKFAGEWPWAHLDIASTAWNDSKPEFNGDYSPTMATGVGVRLLVDMIRGWEPLARKGKGRAAAAATGAPAGRPAGRGAGRTKRTA